MEEGRDESTVLLSMAESGAVFGPQFCAPHPIGLTFTRKAPGVKSGRLAVVDGNGDVIFKVESFEWSLRSKHKVVDVATGSPLVSVQEKLRSMHDRWQVFKGDSTDPKDLLFSVKKSSALNIKTELRVFMAANTREQVCDYKIKGSYRQRTAVVYKGDSSMAVAQMSKEQGGEFGKNAFRVMINPNTDSLFIVALVLVIRELLPEEYDFSVPAELIVGAVTVAMST